MIKKIISLILIIKPIGFLVLLFLNRGKSSKLKSFLLHPTTSIGCNTTIMEGSVSDNLTIIGKYCYIGRYCYLTKVNIGNYCSIANNVSIGQGEHDLSKISTNAVFYENAYEKLTQADCKIGNDVWIGASAIVRRGVEIGNGAVIGANAVVTKDIPPYAIAVGSPARVIRYRFDDNKINLIENSKWWLANALEAKKIFRTLEPDE